MVHLQHPELLCCAFWSAHPCEENHLVSWGNSVKKGLWRLGRRESWGTHVFSELRNRLGLKWASFQASFSDPNFMSPWDLPNHQKCAVVNSCKGDNTSYDYCPWLHLEVTTTFKTKTISLDLHKLGLWPLLWQQCMVIPHPAHPVECFLGIFRIFLNTFSKQQSLTLHKLAESIVGSEGGIRSPYQPSGLFKWLLEFIPQLKSGKPESDTHKSHIDR